MRGDEGYTLTEMLVAMMITGVLAATVAATIITSNTTLRASRSVATSSSEVRVALENIERTVRTATVPLAAPSALISAETNQVSFYALLNRTSSASATQPAPSRVDYLWTGSCLNQRITLATAVAFPAAGASPWSWDVSGGQTVCVLRTTVAPVFSYSSTAAGTPALAAPLSDADRAATRSIGLDVTVPAPGSYRPVSAQVRMSLVNLQAVSTS